MTSVCIDVEPDLISRLTEKEVEVLVYLGNAYTSDEIVDSMNISKNTLSAHKSMIYSKLGISSVSEAVLISIKSGLVTP